MNADVQLHEAKSALRAIEAKISEAERTIVSHKAVRSQLLKQVSFLEKQVAQENKRIQEERARTINRAIPGNNAAKPQGGPFRGRFIK